MRGAFYAVVRPSERSASELRERRVAQIVRDYIEAVSLAAAMRRQAEVGRLEFDAVHRFVGDSDESALFRLKEESHALFRFAQGRPESEVHAEELFDLAVGALFHEAMKFREGFYLTRTYGGRLERMVEAGTASPELAESFRRVFQAGRQRMRESQSEVAALFEETREQLLSLLRQFPRSGAIARSLLELPDRTEAVLGVSIDELLTRIYGSPAAAYGLAVESLVQSGHFGIAVELLSREDAVRAGPLCEAARRFAGGMDAYVKGDAEQAALELGGWVESGGRGPASWRATAEAALGVLAREGDPRAERALISLAGIS
jgi:hypothetical protein